MHRLPSRRRAFSSLTVLTVAAALAGCGGDDKADTGGGDGGNASSGDAQELLKAGFLNVSLDGKPITSGAFALKVSGKIDVPNDKDLKHLEGTASITGAVDANPDGKPFPPMTVSFDVDGNYVDGKDKKGTGAYKGGFTYIGDGFYANWDGTDYAVGEELSKQLLDEISKASATAGGAGATSPLAGYDPQKIVDAMDLDAGTWLKDAKVEDGGEVDGVATQKISGPVDVKVVADDITEGLRKLPAAMPELPGVKELSSITDADDKDLAELEKAVSKLDLAVWVGKDDKVQRRMTLDIAFDTEEDGDPIKGDVLLDITTSKLNQRQDIAAPKDTQPITDLILKLQSEFGDLLGGGSPAVASAPAGA